MQWKIPSAHRQFLQAGLLITASAASHLNHRTDIRKAQAFRQASVPWATAFGTCSLLTVKDVRLYPG